MSANEHFDQANRTQTKDEKTRIARMDELSMVGIMRRLFWMTPAERRAEERYRLRRLSQLIEVNPDAAVNYVLRGELQLDLKAFADARADFEQALARTQSSNDLDGWGVVTQALRDRAQRGLAQTIRYTGGTE